MYESKSLMEGNKSDYSSPQTEVLVLQSDQSILNVSDFDRQDGEWE